MTAIRSLDRGAHPAPWSTPGGMGKDVPCLVVRAAGACAAAALAGCGSLLALRRLGGAIEPANPALVLGGVAVGIPLLLAADAGRRAGGSLVSTVVARCGLVLAVAALALPPRATAPADWIALVAAVIATAVTVGRAPAARGAAWLPARPRSTTPTVSRHPRDADRRRRRDPQAGMLRQRFERRELPAGSERVRGRVVVGVPAGGKVGYGHLGFCPAFVATPTVDVTTAYDGVEVVVSAAEVLPWGLRVECRLAEPAEESLDIPVDVVALAQAAASSVPANP
jgi:hypothetical protein